MNFCMYSFFASLFYIYMPLMGDLQPYDFTNKLPFTYYFVDNSYVLNTLVDTNSAGVVIDVESADGGVARYLAQQAIPSISQIYSINLWESPNHTQKYQFQHFLSNVINEGTTNLITPIRMSSDEAARGLNIQADLIFINSIDEINVYRGILEWSSHLSTVGIICGNNWNDSSVKIGVARAADMLDLVLNVSDTIWYLQKD